ncbi:MAG: hypothetical protein ABR551_02490 [Gemmatimonadales bacterium]
MIRNVAAGLMLVVVAGCGGADDATAQLAVGQQWYSTRGHVSCTDQASLEVIIALVANDQQDVLNQILSAPPEQCFRLRPALQLTVVSISEGKDVIEVRPDGMEGTIWVIKEALVRTVAEIPPPPNGVEPDSA